MNRRRRIVWGIALIFFLASVFVLGPTWKRRANHQPPLSLEVPHSLYAVDEHRTPEDFEQVLRGFKIRPYRAPLGRDEIVALNTILAQMVFSAQAEGVTISLPFDCDLFATLDATMEDEPGWWILSHRARDQGKIELFSVAAFISASKDKR